MPCTDWLLAFAVSAVRSAGASQFFCLTNIRLLVSSPSPLSSLCVCIYVSTLVCGTVWVLVSRILAPCTVIYEDNKGCRDGSKNFGSAAGRAKHMGVKKNFVQAHVNIGTISVTECSSADMVADLLTKPIGAVVYRKLYNQLMSNCTPLRL